MAATRRGCRTRLGCRKNSGGDRRPRLGLPESIRVLGQLLRISKMFGRHSLTQRRREPLKVESQEELASGLIRLQLGSKRVLSSSYGLGVAAVIVCRKQR